MGTMTIFMKTQHKEKKKKEKENKEEKKKNMVIDYESDSSFLEFSMTSFVEFYMNVQSFWWIELVYHCGSNFIVLIILVWICWMK